MTTGNYEMKKIDGWHKNVEKDVVQAEFDALPKQSSRSTSEAAKLLNIPRRTFGKWIKDGSIIVKEKKVDTVVATTTTTTTTTTVDLVSTTKKDKKREKGLLNSNLTDGSYWLMAAPSNDTDTDNGGRTRPRRRSGISAGAASQPQKRTMIRSEVLMAKKQRVVAAKEQLESHEKKLTNVNDLNAAAHTEMKTVLETANKFLAMVEVAKTALLDSNKMAKDVLSSVEIATAKWEETKLSYEKSENDFEVIDIDALVEPPPILANFKRYRHENLVTIIDTGVMLALQQLYNPKSRNDFMKSLQQDSKIMIQHEDGNEELAQVSSISFG